MVNQIVFLVCWPITVWEASRWGFDYLRGEGLTVQVYDVSALVNGRALRRSPVANALEDPCIRRFDSYASFADALGDAAGSTMFIDYIMGLAPVDFRTEKIYRMLGQNRARYCVISAGALPEMFTPRSFNEVVKRLLYDLSLAANPRTLFNFLAKKMIAVLALHTRVYPSPDLIFGGESGALNGYRARYGIAAEKIVPIHSIDHDIYLGYRAQGGSVAPIGTCVFLDEAATHHPDFALWNIRPLEEKPYFADMDRLFEQIERETGLTVVVAAHPRSDYAAMSEAFGGRAIVKGKTVQLVAQSSLVVTHASTAVSFAVLFEKPLLLVKTQGVADSGHYSLMVDTMARSLGIEPLLITKEESPSLPPLSGIPLDGYRDYLYKYVKSPALDDATVWEVVSREIRRQNAAQALITPVPDA